MDSEPGTARRLLLGLLWFLVASQLVTLHDNARFVLFERGSASHLALLAAYLVTSAGFLLHGTLQKPLLYSHLALVVAVFIRHPMSVPFERDGLLILLAGYMLLVLHELSVRKEMLLLVASTIVGLGIVETGLSIVDPGTARPSEELADYGDLLGEMKPGGALRPGLDREMIGPYGPVSVVTNSLGFRNREELDLRRASEGARILLVGDSFVAGYRVDQDATIGARLQAELGSLHGHPVDVWIAAGGGPGDYLEYLSRFGFGLDPDLVVIGITIGNDVAAAYASSRGVPLHRGPMSEQFLPDDAFLEGLATLPLRAHRSLHGWRWYGVLDGALWPQGIGSWLGDTPREVHLFDGIHGLGLFYSQRPLRPVEEAFEAVVGIMAEIHRRGTVDRVPVLFVLIPQRFQVSRTEWEAVAFDYGLAPRAFDLERPDDEILSRCARIELRCVDLLQALRSADGDLYMPRGDMHWNSRGHAVAAASLAPLVADVLRDGRT